MQDVAGETFIVNAHENGFVNRGRGLGRFASDVAAADCYMLAVVHGRAVEMEGETAESGWYLDADGL